MSRPVKKAKEPKQALNGVPGFKGLVNDKGVAYKDFSRGLGLVQSRVWADMAVPWVFILVLVAVFYFLRANTLASALLVVPASLWLSFWMHAYTLFFHEAAHFNIHRDRDKNDLLANIIMTPFTGMWVKDYRVSHWKHHLYLGKLNDTEISYHKPVSAGQVVEGLTGIYLLKTVWRYLQNFRSIDEGTSKTGSQNKATGFVVSLALMLVTQMAIVAGLYYFISIFAAVTWLANMFVTGPFIAHLRQSLEHRSLNADKNTDYSKVEHGAVLRMFGDGFFSRYFGGAGFNRHMLHHYDPSLSYTRFDDVEKFLAGTPIKTDLEASRTTYLKTFLALTRQ